MSHEFGIFITDVSPAEAIRLFNVEVEEGKDSYVMPVQTQDGNYVFYSGLTRQITSDIIFESTGMSLETYARCTRVSGPVDKLQTTLIDNAVHKITSDFLVLSAFEEIIAMRKNGKVKVNTLAEKRFGLDLRILDIPHQFRKLPSF